MRFRDDDRAVTVQIGAVLLFATLVIALSLYQATVVPSQNADVEYKHSQTVQNQLTDVRNGILRSAATGNAQPTSVTLGTQYPSRVFLMNPPPATGTLRTGSYGNDTILVSNVAATNAETRDFLNGAWNASTKYLAYEPNYHEYDNAPILLYEASILSNYYPNAGGGTAIPLTEQLLVDNETRTITLVTLDGQMSTTRAGSVTVSPETLSAPYQRVQVTNASSGPVNVSVPTRLSASQLENRTDLGSHPGVVDVVDVADENRVVVRVDWTGQFTLQTARIGVGSRTQNPPPEYLTLVENRGDRVTVEARDRFNNAEGGVRVRVAAGEPNPFGTASKTTNENGRATFDVRDGESATTTLEILGGTDADDRVTVSVDATAGGGVGDGDGGRLVQVGDAFAFDGADPDATPGGVNLTVRNKYGSTVNITDVTVEPEDVSLNGLSDKAGGEGYGQSEIHVESLDAGASATVDVPLVDAQYTYVSGRGLTLSVDRPREERVYDTSTQSYTAAETTLVGGPVALGPTDRAEIAFAEFYEVGTSTASGVNASGEQFRVTVSYTRDGNTSVTDQFVVTPQPPGATGGGGGGGDSAPSIDTFQTTDTSVTRGNPKYARFDVDWAVSDDTQLQDLDLTMTRVSDGQVVDTASPPVSGTATSGSTTLRGQDQSSNPSGQQYDITLTVTDDAGQTTTQTQRVTV